MSNVTPIATPINLFEQWRRKQQLTEAEVALMGVRLLNPSEGADVLGYPIRHSSVFIPYPGTPYFRVRLLGDVPDGFKYLSRRSSGCAPPYLSPLLAGGMEWSDVQADVGVPVVLTEGELKAACGCKHGVVTVGLGGVEMQATLFEAGWEWSGRVVMVCFDHDAGQARGEYKPGVANALGRLCSTLMQHGAQVAVLRLGMLEQLDPTQKWGLDDALGVGVLWEDIIATAGAAPEWCGMLSELLESCVYVVGTNHTHVYNLLNNSRKSIGDFHDAHIEKRRLVVRPDGKAKAVQVSQQWVEHKARLTVSNYTLDPKLPFGVCGEHINLWRGYPVRSMGDAARAAWVQEQWQQFMEGLFGEHWQWVGLWAGHLLNRPWERCNQAVLLITMVQGIGKSLFGDVLKDLTGVHGLECSSSRMFKDFNSDMEGKTFVMVNELDVKFNAREGQLNDLLSQETMSIEQKGKDVIILPNLRRWYMTANSASPCRLSPGQRRVLVIHPPRTVDDTRGEWGSWVRDVVAEFRRDEGALAAIREWFDKLWREHGAGWSSVRPVEVTQASLDVSEGSMTTGQIIAQHMYEAVEAMEGSWASVHPDLRKANVKAWAEVTNLVKARGGMVGNKSVKEEGRVVCYTIYDVRGGLERMVKASGNANVKVEPVEVKARAVVMATKYREILEILTGR